MRLSLRASPASFELTLRWLLVIAAGILIFNLLRYSGCLIDDAYISLRYAHNLVQGHGLVFNPGERVEGYTNFSFVMLAALLLRCGLDPISWLRGMLLVALAATLWGTARLERLALPGARWLVQNPLRREARKKVSFADTAPPHLPLRVSDVRIDAKQLTAGVSIDTSRMSHERQPRRCDFIAVRSRMGVMHQSPSGLPVSLALLAPLQSLAFWSVCPMETMLFTALLVWGVTTTIEESRSQRRCGTAFVFALLALTRPEGIYLYGVTTAAAACSEWLCGSFHLHLRRHIINTGIFSSFLMTHLLWRRWYYGAWVPNTFTAKTTWSRSQLQAGFTSLIDWLSEHPLLLLGLATSLLMMLLLGQRSWCSEGRGLLVVWTVTVAWLVYVLLIGGDFMPFFRFFVPVLPFCCLLLAWPLQLLLRAQAWQIPGLVIVVATHVGLGLSSAQEYRALMAHRTAVAGESVGRWLGEELDGQLIAVNTAGALPYHADLPAVDMLGLSEAEIARRPVFVDRKGWSGHCRGWGRHVLSRKPSVILFYNSAGAGFPHYLSDQELAAHPVFRFFFRYRSTTLPSLAQSAPATPFSWMPGLPFATQEPRLMDSLGLVAIGHQQLLPWTELRERGIRVRYFALSHRDQELWPADEIPEGGAQKLVEQAVELWQQQSRQKPVADPTTRSKVESLCLQVRQLVETGLIEETRPLLDRALQLNRAVQSPLVFQYIANVAVLSGDLWTALTAQKEALRLDPACRLYQRNLIYLLEVPYDQLSASTSGWQSAGSMAFASAHRFSLTGDPPEPQISGPEGEVG